MPRLLLLDHTLCCWHGRRAPHPISGDGCRKLLLLELSCWQSILNILSCLILITLLGVAILQKRKLGLARGF